MYIDKFLNPLFKILYFNLIKQMSKLNIPAKSWLIYNYYLMLEQKYVIFNQELKQFLAAFNFDFKVRLC